MAVSTKSDILRGAFSQLRISGITVNPTAEDNVLALDRLEDMAQEWEGRNMCINFAFEDSPDPATVTGVDPKFNQALKTNLALRLVPDFGKDRADIVTLQTQATQSLSNLSALTARVNPTRYPDRMAVGSGNTYRWNRWVRYYRERPNVVVSCETQELQLNSKADYIATWADWLESGETITSFEIVNTNGLEISGAVIQNNSTEIFYTVKGILCGAQKVTISIVTSLSTPDNADTRTVDFDIIDNNSTS